VHWLYFTLCIGMTYLSALWRMSTARRVRYGARVSIFQYSKLRTLSPFPRSLALESRTRHYTICPNWCSSGALRKCYMSTHLDKLQKKRT